MATAFRTERLTSLVMPELLVLAGLAAVHMIARSLDARLGLHKAFRRPSDWISMLALGGSAYMYSTGRNPEVAKTIFIGDSMLVTTSIADALFQKVGASVGSVGAKVLGAGSGTGAFPPRQLPTKQAVGAVGAVGATAAQEQPVRFAP